MAGTWNYGSREKLDVTVKQSPWNKPWVEVQLLKGRGGSFWPSFEDLFRIVQGICECEDTKYPGGRGRDMVADFLQDACYEPDFEVLRDRYGIPARPLEPVKVF